MGAVHPRGRHPPQNGKWGYWNAFLFMFLSAFHEGLSHPVNIITKWDVLDILWRNDNRDMIDDTLAEPVFPRAGGVNPRVWAENRLFGKIFAENCMKIREMDREGARP